MGKSQFDPAGERLVPWNADRIVDAKRPLKPRDVWAIRFYLDEHHRRRDRALFDLALDSKLRGCDVVKLKIGDVVAGGSIRNRAIVIQQKTRKPVQFELGKDVRESHLAWLSAAMVQSRTMSFLAALIALAT
jgi:site-specific recombinase XerC